MADKKIDQSSNNPELKKQIKEICNLVVTAKSTEKDIEKGKKMIQKLEESYDFNIIYQEIQDQISQNISIYDEKNSTNLIKYMENLLKEKNPKPKIQLAQEITQEDENFIQQIFQEDPQIKDIMANLARSMAQEINITKDSLFAIQINSKIEKLKNQFQLCNVSSRIEAYFNKKKQQIQKQTFIYFRNIYGRKHRKICPRILNKLKTQGFYSIKNYARNKKYDLTQFQKILTNTHNLFKDKLLHFALLKIREKQFNFQKLRQSLRLIQIQKVKNLNDTLKRLRLNMYWERKKLLPASIMKLSIILQHNNLRRHLKKWQNHTSQRNSHLIKRMVKVIFQRQTQLIKICLYKLAYQVATGPITDFTKITAKIKGKIFQALRKQGATLTKNQAYIRWKFRASKQHMQHAIKGMVMHAKLNPQIILWRLQHQLPKNRPIKKITRIKKRNMALIVLFHVYEFLRLKNQKIAFEKIIKRSTKGLQKTGKAFSAFQFLVNLFNRQNYKYSFEKIKMLHQQRLEVKDNFHAAAIILNQILDAKFILMMQAKFNIWHQKQIELKKKKQFFSILLRSSQGMLLTFFKEWRDLPDLKGERLKQNSIQLVDLLEMFLRRKLIQSFNSLTDQLDEGETGKKRVCMDLFDKATQQHLKAFYLWANFTMNQKQITKCRRTGELMEAIHLKLQQNMALVLENNRLRELKSGALNRIIQCFHHGLTQLFQQWHRKARFQSFQSQKLKHLINMIKVYMNRSQNIQLSQTLRKFNKNSSIFNIIKNFYDSLLSTKAGYAYKLLLLMKGLPDKSQKRQGNIFQAKMSLITSKKINQDSFKYLKKYYSDGGGIQRNTLSQLIYLTMGNQKRLFLKWRNLVIQKRILNRCCYTTQLYNNIQKVIQQNTQLVFVSSHDYELKKNSINRLLANYNNKMRGTMRIWSSNANQKKLQDDFQKDTLNQAQKDMIKQLTMVLKKNQNTYLRKVLNSFFSRSQIYKRMYSFYNNILDKSIGRVYNVFLAIKSLPVRPDHSHLSQCNNFEKALRKFSNNRLNIPFFQFKGAFLDGEQKKQQLTLYLVKQAMNGQQKSFQMWLGFVQNYKAVRQCTMITNLYDSLNQVLSSKVFGFLNDDDYEKKIKAIQRLLLHSQNKLKVYFQRFQQQAQKKALELALGSSQKQQIIRMLHKFVNDNNKSKLRDVLHQFVIFKNTEILKNGLFSKFDKSLKQVLLLMFHKIANLPERPDYDKMEKCNTVQSKLESFFKIRVKKYSFNFLTDDYYKGNQNRQYILVKFIQATVGEGKTKLQQWRSHNYMTNERLRMKQAITFFHDINNQIHLRFASLKDGDRESKIKEQVILKILFSGINKLRKFFVMWNHNGKLKKITQSIKDNEKQIFIRNLHKFIDSSQKNQLRNILYKFQRNRSNQNITQKIMKIMLNTTNGKVIKLFKLWKVLPEKKNKARIRNTNEFSDRLERLYFLKLNQTFNPLKNVFFRCQKLKIRLILALSFKNLSKNEQNLSIVLYKMAQNKLNDTTNKILSETQKYKIQYFQSKITNLSHLSLIKSFRQMQNQNLEALQQRKNIIKTLIILTTNKQLKFLMRWDNDVKRQKQILNVKKTNQFFSFLNQQILSNLSMVTQSEKDLNIKIQVIQKLFEKIKNNINHCLLRWNSNSKICKINEQINSNEKQYFIKYFARYLQNAGSLALRRVLKQFSMNNYLKGRQKLIFNKILIITSGRMIIGFRTWKNLPPRINHERNQNANQLEDILNRLQLRRFQLVRNKLQDASATGDSKKIQIIRQFIYATQSKQQILFNSWKKQTDEEIIIQRSRETVQFFTNINSNIISKFGIINDSVSNLQNQMKQQILEKMLYIKSRDLQSLFKLWFYKAKFLTMDLNNDGVIKKILVDRLQFFFQHKNKSSVRGLLDKFYINSRLQILKIKICNQFQKTVVGKANTLFNRMKALPERIQLKQSTFFEQNFLNLLNRRLRGSFESLQQQLYRGNTNKNMQIRHLVLKTQSKQQQYLQSWNEQTNELKVVCQCSAVQTFMGGLNKIFKLKFKNCFFDIDPRKFDLQVQVINRILRQLTPTLERYFYFWLQNAKLRTIQVKMGTKYKQYFLKNLNKFLNRGGRRQIRECLWKFNRNAKLQIFTRNILNKMLDTKSGRINAMFQMWKGLPPEDPIETELTPQQQGFKNILKIFNKNVLKPLSQENIPAENSKRKTVNLWLYKILRPEMKAILNWKKQVRNLRLFENISLINSTFDSLNQQAQNNFRIVLDSERATTIKQQIIQKMQINFNNSQSQILKKWLFITKMCKIQDQISNTQKEYFINKLHLFLKQSTLHKLRNVLNKAEINKNLQKLKLKVFRRMMQTGVGKFLTFFSKWKCLPEKRDFDQEDKSNQFERKLARTARFLIKKQSFDLLSGSYLEGCLKQKESIMFLIHKNKTKISRLFETWRKKVSDEINAKKFKQVSNFIQFTNNTIIAHMGIIIQDRNTNIKEKALRQMFYSSSSRLENSFNKWRQNSKILTVQLDISQKISNDMKKKLIDSLTLAMTTEKSSKFRETLQKFYENLKVIRIQKMILNKMMKANFGLILKGFSNRKNIPFRKRKDRANKVEHALMLLVKRRLRQSFSPLNEQQAICSNYKQRCILSFIEKTMSKSNLMFLKWNLLSKRGRVLNQCQTTVSFFQKISEIQKNNMLIIFRNQQDTLIMQKAMEALFRTKIMSMERAFKHWNFMNRVGKLQQLFEGQKQKDMIDHLTFFLKHNLNENKRRVINKFFVFTKVKKICLRFFEAVKMQGLGKAQKIFEIIKTLPEKIDYKGIQNTNEFQKRLLMINNRVVNLAFSRFKSKLAEGESLKSNNMYILFLSQMDLQKKLFLRWKSETLTLKCYNQSKQIFSFFSDLNNQLTKVIIDPILSSEQINIKTQIIDKMFINFQNKVKYNFIKWHYNCKQQALINDIQDDQKKQMIIFLTDFLKKNQKFQLRKCIYNFDKNNKIYKIQYKFMNNLLDCSLGKAFNFLLKIKSIPTRKDDEELKKLNSFQGSLDRFYKKRVGIPLQKFILDSQEGIARANSSIIHLINLTSGQMKHRFSLWNQVGFTMREMEKGQRTLDLFHNLNNSIISQISFNALKKQKRQQKMQSQAIDKMIKNSSRNQLKMLLLWRDKINQIKFLEQIGDTNKEFMILNLQEFLKFNLKSQTSKVLIKFYRNSRIRQIQNKFFKQCQFSKSGKLSQMFISWMKLPQNKDYKQIATINEYEKRINLIFTTRVKLSLSAFPLAKQEGDKLKQRIISQLVYVTSSNFRKSLIQWRHITQMFIQANKVKQTINLFSRINEITRSKLYKGVFMNENQQQIMLQALNIMGQNQQQKLRLTLKKWKIKVKENKISQNLDESSKSRAILGLKQFLRGNSNEGLRKVLWKFKKSGKASKLIKAIFNTVMSTSLGKQLHVLQMIKNLPNKRNDEQSQKTNKFQNSLLNIGQRSYKKAFNKMVAILQDGEAQQRRLMFLMVERTQSKHQIMFQRWYSSAQRLKGVQICKKTMNFVQLIHSHLKTNTFDILLERKNQLIIVSALKRMVDNAKNQQEKIFGKWKLASRAGKISEQLTDLEKDKAIKGLIHFFKSSNIEVIRKTLNKFKINGYLQKITSKFMRNCLNTKLGHLSKLFTVWKNLPQKLDKNKIENQSIFERKLVVLINKKVQVQSFRKLKSYIDQGEVTKKLICNTLFRKIRGGFHNMFLKWHEFGQNQKKLDMAKQTSNLFHNLNSLLDNQILSNLGAEAGNKTDMTKHFALRAIIKNCYNQKHFAFDLWKHQKKLHDIKKRFSSKLMIVSVLDNLAHNKLRFGFFNLVQECDMIITKNSCNSIWKWKLSNIEAKYYKKFRTLYQQTQFLMGFCGIFEKKRYEILQYGINKIKLQLLNKEVLKRMMLMGAQYCQKQIDVAFYKWHGIVKQLKLQESNDQLLKDQYGNSCLDLLQNLLNKRTRWSMRKLAQNAHLKRFNNYQTSTEALTSLYLQRLRIALYKIENRGKLKSNAQLALGKIKYFIYRKSASQFFVQYKQLQKGADNRALQIYAILQSFLVKQKKHGFDKLKRIVILIRRMVEICQKYSDNRPRFGLNMIEQRAAGWILKRKMRSLILLQKLNKWKEKRTEHEALRIWMAAGKISRINNAWLVRSLNYLAKNVKINGLVSYWRLRDFALNQQKKQKQQDQRLSDRFPMDISMIQDTSRINDMTQSRLTQNVQDVLNTLDRNSYNQKDLKNRIMNLKQVIKRIIHRNLYKAFINVKNTTRSSIFLGHQDDDVKNPLNSQPYSPISTPHLKGNETPQFQYEQEAEKFSDQLQKQLVNDFQIQKIRRLVLVLKTLYKKNQFQSFNIIKNDMIRKKQLLEYDGDDSGLGKQQLIERDNELMKEINNVKESNKVINDELKDKENELLEAFHSIGQLHTRLNYMITNRVINILDKYREGQMMYAFKILQDED